MIKKHLYVGLKESKKEDRLFLVFLVFFVQNTVIDILRKASILDFSISC
jgi:hypothetical protein